jgi:hypothetical protein
MPKAYAERLAALLVADAESDPLVVDVPNDGFSDEVAAALETMGYRVDRAMFKPRLTIYRPKVDADVPGA